MCHQVVTHFTQCAHRVETHTICSRSRRHQKRRLAQAHTCRTGCDVQLARRDALCGGCEAMFAGPQRQRQRQRQHPGPLGWEGGTPTPPMVSAYGTLLGGEGVPYCGLEHVFRRTLRIRDGEGTGRDGLGQSRGPSHVSKGVSASSAPSSARVGMDGGGGGGERIPSSSEPAVASSTSSGGPEARKSSRKRVRFSREVDVRYFQKDERVRCAAIIESVA